jgi:hypothetical protein
MKNITMPRTVVLDEEIRKQLFQEVKETLAKDFLVKKTKRFTAAELWSLQRNRRFAGGIMRR